MFYPEGGGQPADMGTLSTDDTTVEIEDVQIVDGVILHRADEDPGKGELVNGQVDGERRRQLMRHHTATHIVIHAARQVLGEHIRQAGAQKGVESSRIDVRHYDRIDRGTVKRIEDRANEIVMDNTAVSQEWPDRHDAEAEYGFDLYQGGIPPGEQIRLIHVDEDTQACGGTHARRPDRRHRNDQDPQHRARKTASSGLPSRPARPIAATQEKRMRSMRPPRSSTSLPQTCPIPPNGSSRSGRDGASRSRT